MKHRVLGIFGKVFSYTMLILILVIVITFAFFAEQIKTVVESTQRQQISTVFEPLLRQLEGKTHEEIIEVAVDFHKKNASFEFSFISLDKEILYKTKNFIMPENDVLLLNPKNVIVKGYHLTQNKFHFTASSKGQQTQFVTLASENVRLFVSGTISSTDIYNKFAEKALMALLLIIMASALAAVIFAGRIANPIKKIVSDTKKMSDLEFVPAPDVRKDEIGRLAQDVYKMYKT
ncbi:TPA: hypothetical protein QCR75_006120, partial [Bacillus anthracis]|nr:hypothetical protein [Bacillus anthracis]